MSRRATRSLLGVLFLLSAATASGASSLPPYKDDYFAYPGVISSADNGDYKVVGYNEMRDINGRDAVPEKRVKDAYVSLKARAYQKDVTFQTKAGPVKAMTAGKREGASFIVIYLHGRGGNRLQGMNDFTFGGNFNRVKNLAALNGGLYVTPDFKDFADAGEAQIAGLIEAVKASSPSAPLILSCGSQGGTLCWRIAGNENAGSQLSGLILLAERPFKVGDWVEAGTVSGIVKKISVRATEVETFQKQSIIVPNSTLINGNVGNWTHRNKLGRIDINVQASYTAEPRRVHALLLEIVRGHPSILKNPEPFVAFQSMNDSLMVFDIYAHVADITSTGGIKNELRFQIVERFHEEGLHLSSSSTDLILSVPEIEKLSGLMQQERENSSAVRTKKASAEKPEAKDKDDDRA